MAGIRWKRPGGTVLREQRLLAVATLGFVLLFVVAVVALVVAG